MPVPNSIVSLAQEVGEWRRDIHAHPELGYRETRTAGIVEEKLKAFGLDEVHAGIGRTGVIGVLHGAGGKAAGEAESVLLRADMDALPIHEESGVPHASTQEGVMHACGHDGHTAMLLGAARHLAETRNFKGTVYFCFQPAEEGGAGAAAMIQDGLFERFPSRAVFGMHNWPGLPPGAFGIRPGPTFASASQFRIKVTGSGGHAALPNVARDPIPAAAALVLGLQTILSRNVNPLDPAVLSVTYIKGGDAFNVIPDRITLGGTVRSFTEAVHELVYRRMDQIVAGLAAAHEVKIEIERPGAGYPATVNDAELTEFAADTAVGIAGADAVDRDFPKTLGGEDFAFLANTRPGAFILIGSGEEHPRLHTAGYDFNDEILPSGIAYWAQIVERALPVES